MSHSAVVSWDIGKDATVSTLDAESECVIAIGVFDGLHAGHRVLLDDAASDARARGARLLVVTFERDPDEVFRPDKLVKLVSNERRLDMLAEHTGATVVALTLTDELFGFAPEEFLDKLSAACKPLAFHVGSDFRFGYMAKGTVDDMTRWGAAHGCACMPHELVELAGGVVTSTRIRGVLEQGDVALAKQLLGGRAHSICGRVVRGRGEGTGFGFATANLDLTDNVSACPAEGVYGGYVRVSGTMYPAAINMGRAVSFDAATAPLETHLLGFEGDLYETDVEVYFEQWLRAQRVFEDKDELIATVMGNIEWVRENLGGGPQ